MTNLTAASLRLFSDLYDDAGNWGGTPLFGGNVGGDKASRGNLTDLKKNGLLTTQVDEDDKSCSWVIFTDAGHEFAKTLTGTSDDVIDPTEIMDTEEYIASVSAANFVVKVRSDLGLVFDAPVNAADAKEAVKMVRAAVKEAGISRSVGTIHFRAVKA